MFVLAWSFLKGVLLTATLAYLACRFTFIGCYVPTLLLRFLAWHTDRLAKNRTKNPTLVKLAQDLFRSMPDVLANVPGPILELGAGSGANLGYFPPRTELITVDLNEHFHPYLKANLVKHNHVKLREMMLASAEDLSSVVPDESVSCVVSSLLLCCVDQQKCLREIYRVLKPGGRFFFKEHIIERPGTFTNWFQRTFEVYWAALRGNCHLSKQTDQTIARFPSFVNLQASIVQRDLPAWAFFCRRSYVGYVDKPIN